MVVVSLQSRHLGGVGRKFRVPSATRLLRSTTWMMREELFSNFQMMFSALSYQYCYAYVKKKTVFQFG